MLQSACCAVGMHIDDSLLVVNAVIGEQVPATLSFNEDLRTSWVAVPLTGKTLDKVCGLSDRHPVTLCKTSLAVGSSIVLPQTPMRVITGLNSVVTGEIAAHPDSDLFKTHGQLSIRVGFSVEHDISIGSTTSCGDVNSPSVSSPWTLSAEEIQLSAQVTKSRKYSVSAFGAPVKFSLNSNTIAVPKSYVQHLLDKIGDFDSLAIIPSIEITFEHLEDSVRITPPMYVDDSGISSLVLSESEQWTIGLEFLKGYTIVFDGKNRGVRICRTHEYPRASVNPSVSKGRSTWLAWVVNSIRKPRSHSEDSGLSSSSDR